MLVTMKEILDHAHQGNYAVAAPNVFYELETRAVLELAEQLNSPIILDVMPMMGPEIIRLATLAKVPVAVNLDHGRDYQSIVSTMRKGVSSVMVDRSILSFEENVKEVSEIVKIAHAMGISVEAELGHVGQGDNYEVDGKNCLTVPEEAARYVELTGVDMLAVAIGTAHGKYVGTPHLDFELLQKIDAVVDVPLVLHGGSGTGFENIAKACKLGINKVNVNTDLMTSALHTVALAVEQDNPIMLFPSIAQGYQKVLKQYIDACGSAGKAWQCSNTSVSNEPAMHKMLKKSAE